MPHDNHVFHRLYDIQDEEDEMVKDIAESMTLKELVTIVLVVLGAVLFAFYIGGARADVPTFDEVEALCEQHKLSCHVDGDGSIWVNGQRYTRG